MRDYAAAAWRVQRLLWANVPAWAILIYACAAVAATAPNILIVAVGRLVGSVLSAQSAAGGAGVGAGSGVWVALGVAGVALAFLLMIEPAQDVLRTIVGQRLRYLMASKLMLILTRPVGTGHLADAENLSSIAMNRGALTSFRPAEAPALQVRLMGVKLSGAGACCIVGTFRPWLGAGLFAMWLLARRPLRKVIKDHVSVFGGEAGMIRRAVYFSRLTTAPEQAKEIRLFGLGSWVLARYREHWLLGMATVWQVRARLFRAVSLVGLGVIAANLVACGVLADAVIHRQVGLTALATIFPAIIGTSAVGGISFDDIALEWMLAGLPHLDRLQRVVNDAERVLTGWRPVDGLPSSSVTFEQVRFRYPGAAAEVFSGLDLHIVAGQSTAIVGANGAGKTTLIKLLTRMHDPDGGRITVDGMALAEVRPREWQRNCALISQQFARYPLAARENIGFGAVEWLTDEAGLQAAARRAGVLDLIAGLPGGWDTRLAPDFADGTDLSGGQWQRIALARALFAVQHGARLLIMDEPTAALDIDGEIAFYEQFHQITSGLTTVVISHRLSTVRQAHVIHLLDAGRLLESGGHDELMAASGPYAEMFRSQAAQFNPGPSAVAARQEP